MFIRTNPSLPLDENINVLRQIVAVLADVYPEKLWTVYDREVITKRDFTLRDIETETSTPTSSRRLVEIVDMLDEVISLSFSDTKSAAGKEAEIDNWIPADCETYIEFFDSTYWTVFSRDEGVLLKCVPIMVQ